MGDGGRVDEISTRLKLMEIMLFVSLLLLFCFITCLLLFLFSSLFQANHFVFFSVYYWCERLRIFAFRKADDRYWKICQK